MAFWVEYAPHMGALKMVIMPLFPWPNSHVHCKVQEGWNVVVNRPSYLAISQFRNFVQMYLNNHCFHVLETWYSHFFCFTCMHTMALFCDSVQLKKLSLSVREVNLIDNNLSWYLLWILQFRLSGSIFFVITFLAIFFSFLRTMESISAEKVENMKHSHWIALYLRRK